MRKAMDFENVLDFPFVLENACTKNGSEKVAFPDTTIESKLDASDRIWEFAVRKIEGFDLVVTVTGALTIDGITREAIGTGFTKDPDGIQSAEQDALRRAAARFGISVSSSYAAECQRENDVEQENRFKGFPENPFAASLQDMISAKQLGIIKSVSREADLDPAAESLRHMNCEVAELSKAAASALIDYMRHSKKPDRRMIPLMRERVA